MFTRGWSESLELKSELKILSCNSYDWSKEQKRMNQKSMNQKSMNQLSSMRIGYQMQGILMNVYQ